MTRHLVHDLVAQLTRTQSMRVQVGYRGYSVTAPCLLSQLAEAIETGNDRSGTRGVPGSRPPLDMTALDLWVDITTNVHGWADSLGINRAGYVAAPADSRGPTLPRLGALLRAVAAEATGRAEDNIVDALTRACRRWVNAIGNLFAPGTGQRHLYGAACPHCAESTTISERDGERIQVPAIVITTDHNPDRPLRWLVCQCCGWQRGIPLYETEVAA